MFIKFGKEHERDREKRKRNRLERFEVRVNDFAIIRNPADPKTGNERKS